MMPTIAETVCAMVQDADAYTLEYGYAVFGPTRRSFPLARTVKEKRNDVGRCTHYVGEYDDGSRVVFTYSENRGSALRAVPIKGK